MAEIHIERKPQRKIWPLILGLLVAALVIWGLIAMMNNRADMDAAQLQQSSLIHLNNLNDLVGAPAVDLADMARAA